MVILFESNNRFSSKCCCRLINPRDNIVKVGNKYKQKIVEEREK